MKRLLLTIASLALFGIGVCTPATASATVTGAAVHTSAAEKATLSDPTVIAAARDPEVPAPAPGPETPVLPPARASAKKTDIAITNTSAYPNRIQGKVIVRFENDPDQTYACSGTLVDSVEKNVLFTAGHCTYDQQAKAYPSAMVFIPGYRGDDEGEQPYGVLSATAVKTTNGWVKRSDYRYDMGVAQLEGTPVDQLGARGIAFDMSTNRRKFRIYGYPAAPVPAYNGKKLVRCDTSFKGRDGAEALAMMVAGPCYMQQGASGGGWITGGGYLNSVSSLSLCESSPRTCGVLVGPYFSNQARSLYESVATTVTPRVRFIKSPPRVLRKRKVVVKLGGTGTTPIRDFSCKLDHRSFQKCFPATVISSLSNGRHRLVIYGRDQTGHRSSNRVDKVFRVKPKRSKSKHRNLSRARVRHARVW